MPTPTTVYRGFVYLIGSKRFGWYKIGKSRSASIRIENIGILLPFKIEVFGVWMCENPTLMERLMHERHAEWSINGEWFGFGIKKLKEIINEEPPCHAVLVGDEAICAFSNLGQDSIIDTTDTLKKKQGEQYMEIFREFMRTKGIEDTPENRRAARKYMKAIAESKRDIIFPERQEVENLAGTQGTQPR